MFVFNPVNQEVCSFYRLYLWIGLFFITWQVTKLFLFTRFCFRWYFILFERRQDYRRPHLKLFVLLTCIDSPSWPFNRCSRNVQPYSRETIKRNYSRFEIAATSLPRNFVVLHKYFCLKGISRHYLAMEVKRTGTNIESFTVVQMGNSYI